MPILKPCVTLRICGKVVWHLVVCLVGCVALASGQDANATFSISISGPASVKVSAPATIQITVKNVSGHEIAFDGDSLVYGERNFNLQVLDSEGKQPAETPYMKAVRGEDQGPGETHIVLAGKLIQHDLQPGETLTATVDLSRLFDLPPGTYSVKVSRPDFQLGHAEFAAPDPEFQKKAAHRISPANPPLVLKPKAVALSNTITVKVLP